MRKGDFFFFIKINQTKPRTKHLKILFVGVNVNLKRMKEKNPFIKIKGFFSFILFQLLGIQLFRI